MSNLERPSLKVGDTVKVIARVDNYGCTGVIDSINGRDHECEKKYPISVYFEFDDRDGDPYDLPKFNKRGCYSADELALIIEESK